MTTSALNAQPLRAALRLNGSFSLLSGGAMLVAAAPLARLFELSDPRIFIAVGISLVLFAGGLFLQSRRSEIHRPAAWITVALDLGWVVGSVALLTLAPGLISLAGRVLVAIVAAMVAAVAAAQVRGLRRLS